MADSESPVSEVPAASTEPASVLDAVDSPSSEAADASSSALEQPQPSSSSDAPVDVSLVPSTSSEVPQPAAPAIDDARIPSARSSTSNSRVQSPKSAVPEAQPSAPATDDARIPSARSSTSNSRVQSPKSAVPEAQPSAPAIDDTRIPSARSATSNSRVQSPKSVVPAPLSSKNSSSSVTRSSPRQSSPKAASSPRLSAPPSREASARDPAREPADADGSSPRPGSRSMSRPQSAGVHFEDDVDESGPSSLLSPLRAGVERDLSHEMSSLERSLNAVKSGSSLFDDTDEETDDEAGRGPIDPAAADARDLKRVTTTESAHSYSVYDDDKEYSQLGSVFGGSQRGGSSHRRDSAVDEAHRIDDARNVVLKRLQDARDEQARLLAANEELQVAIGQFFSVNKIDTRDQLGQPDTKNPALTDEERVVLQMKLVHDRNEDLKTLRMYYDELIQEMKKRLDEKENKAQEVSTLFLKFKREIAREAEDSKTGKTISPQLIEHYEQEEIKKDAEVEKVRLKNITLRKQYAGLEKSLRQKEELKNGLHLIDFEQLKIENQTFNEKIEERNEELSKMRKKINNTVHVLSHVKEKLQFLQVQNATLIKNLEFADQQMVDMRDRVGQMKQQRDGLRAENNELKQRSGLIGQDDLLRDYQRRFDELSAAKEQLKSLQEENQRLQEKTAKILRSAATQQQTAKSATAPSTGRTMLPASARFSTGVV